MDKLASWLEPYGLKPTPALSELLAGFEKPADKLWREGIVKAARLYRALAVLPKGQYRITHANGTAWVSWDGKDVDALVRTDPKHSRRVSSQRFREKWLASGKGMKHKPSASPWNTGVGMLLSVLTPATGKPRVEAASFDVKSWNRKKKW